MKDESILESIEVKIKKIKTSHDPSGKNSM